MPRWRRRWTGAVRHSSACAQAGRAQGRWDNASRTPESRTAKQAMAVAPSALAPSCSAVTAPSAVLRAAGIGFLSTVGEDVETAPDPAWCATA